MGLFRTYDSEYISQFKSEFDENVKKFMRILFCLDPEQEFFTVLSEAGAGTEETEKSAPKPWLNETWKKIFSGATVDKR